jgi:heme exporter protein A
VDLDLYHDPREQAARARSPCEAPRRGHGLKQVSPVTGQRMEPPAVETSALGRRYGRRWALARVNLRVARGERLLIAGANGSGKSTLLRVLASLLAPSIGSARVFGHDVATEPSAVRARVALLTYTPGVYEDLSARENLRAQLRLLGRDDAPEALLERVGLELRDDPVRGYSAGMRKRLSFARLLMQRPELALLDEPYGQLDPEGFRMVDGLVAELSQAGATVIMASHMVERAGALCDRGVSDRPGPGALGGARRRRRRGPGTRRMGAGDDRKRGPDWCGRSSR